MEETVKGLVAIIGIIYNAVEIAMPFMIIHIYNKVDELSNKK